MELEEALKRITELEKEVRRAWSFHAAEQEMRLFAIGIRKTESIFDFDDEGCIKIISILK